VCVSVSGLLYSVGVCVCDLWIFLHTSHSNAPPPRHLRSLLSEGGGSSYGRLWCCSCVCPVDLLKGTSAGCFFVWSFVVVFLSCVCVCDLFLFDTPPMHRNGLYITTTRAHTHWELIRERHWEPYRGSPFTPAHSHLSIHTVYFTGGRSILRRHVCITHSHLAFTPFHAQVDERFPRVCLFMECVDSRSFIHHIVYIYIYIYLYIYRDIYIYIYIHIYIYIRICIYIYICMYIYIYVYMHMHIYNICMYAMLCYAIYAVLLYYIYKMR